MIEIWKDINGFEGKYKISNLGNVISLNFNRLGSPKLLKPCVNNSGYLTVNLYGNRKNNNVKVHKLVAIHFLNHIPCGYNEVVNHIDFDKLNNQCNNLELVSSRENSNRKHIKTTSKYVGVSYFKQLKKWRATIVINKKQVSLGLHIEEIDAHNAYQKSLKEINKINNYENRKKVYAIGNEMHTGRLGFYKR